MNQASQTLAQLKKASKLVRLRLSQERPEKLQARPGRAAERPRRQRRHHSARAGEDSRSQPQRAQGYREEGRAQRLRHLEDAEGERTYAVKLTDEGREVAQKRVAANDKTADDIIGCLSEEEIAQLNAITEKLILSMKDKGINGKKKGRKATSAAAAKYRRRV